jgi:hypothetical protein
MVVADPAVASGRAILPDAAPEATATVCTVTVAPVEVTVGVTVTDVTLFGTVEVYDVVPAAKATFREPSLSTSALSVLTVLSAVALFTVTVYILLVRPSCAVTTIAIAVLPMLRLCGPEALPEVTEVPPTETVAPASVVVGVTVMAETAFATLAVYDKLPDARDGTREAP